MDRKESIRNAYRLTGSGSFYDGMITCSTGPGRAVCRLVWDMGKAECDAYLEEAISGIPEGFAGRLLEVPVGTGILTMPLYATLPDAEITCLDYFPGHDGPGPGEGGAPGPFQRPFSAGGRGSPPLPGRELRRRPFPERLPRLPG